MAHPAGTVDCAGSDVLGAEAILHATVDRLLRFRKKRVVRSLHEVVIQAASLHVPGVAVFRSLGNHAAVRGGDVALCRGHDLAGCVVGKHVGILADQRAQLPDSSRLGGHAGEGLRAGVVALCGLALCKRQEAVLALVHEGIEEGLLVNHGAVCAGVANLATELRHC